LFLFSADPPSSEIYPLSLHDALPILLHAGAHAVKLVVPLAKKLVDYGIRDLVGDVLHIERFPWRGVKRNLRLAVANVNAAFDLRSEEHTSELQSRENLVCRLLLEKKK